ncbi:FtsW/RodA/SpoVE family cell cycle protein [Butyrivibrio sp. MC2013]|uniref:FtsW/RodA/SpoVE family cell cycle protein n=1 Tax=Butyrivibrio sp. MC2013 TaxID=1280686 RepID=UPI00040FD430|nr:FtsW/RodA/SpoVE family cell cycle protein [Butyrivibrio sp. MC2013]
MILYITEIAKYITACAAAIYALLGFITLKFKSEKRRKPVYVILTVLLFTILILSFIQILVNNRDISMLLYGIFTAVIVMLLISLFPLVFPDCNRMVLYNAAFLLQTSFIVLVRINQAKGIRQMIIAAASILVSFLVCQIYYKFPIFSRIGFVYGALGVSMLLAVRVIGSMTNGSYLSVTLMGLTFQPSEFAKIMLILFLACTLSGRTDILSVGVCFAVTFVYMLVLLASRDLGASAILFVICLCVVYLATEKIRYLLAGLALGGAGSVLAYFFFSHVRRRFTAWIDPWTNIDGSGYQLTQSLFGISSGGFWGTGLFKGDPSAIPYVEDDFIFSAVANEFGIIYAVSMVCICLGIFLMMLLETARLRDKWSGLLDTGIGISFIFQTFLTVGGGSRFIPLTGVTLPLVSYGGSSIMTSMIMIGLFQATSIIRMDEHYDALARYRGYTGEG